MPPLTHFPGRGKDIFRNCFGRGRGAPSLYLNPKTIRGVAYLSVRLLPALGGDWKEFCIFFIGGKGGTFWWEKMVRKGVRENKNESVREKKLPLGKLYFGRFFFSGHPTLYNGKVPILKFFLR